MPFDPINFYKPAINPTNYTINSSYLAARVALTSLASLAAYPLARKWTPVVTLLTAAVTYYGVTDKARAALTMLACTNWLNESAATYIAAHPEALDCLYSSVKTKEFTADEITALWKLCCKVKDPKFVESHPLYKMATSLLTDAPEFFITAIQENNRLITRHLLMRKYYSHNNVMVGKALAQIAKDPAFDKQLLWNCLSGTEEFKEYDREELFILCDEETVVKSAFFQSWLKRDDLLDRLQRAFEHNRSKVAEAIAASIVDWNSKVTTVIDFDYDKIMDYLLTNGKVKLDTLPKTKPYKKVGQVVAKHTRRQNAEEFLKGKDNDQMSEFVKTCDKANFDELKKMITNPSQLTIRQIEAVWELSLKHEDVTYVEHCVVRFQNEKVFRDKGQFGIALKECISRGCVNIFIQMTENVKPSITFNQKTINECWAAVTNKVIAQRLEERRFEANHDALRDVLKQKSPHSETFSLYDHVAALLRSGAIASEDDLEIRNDLRTNKLIRFYLEAGPILKGKTVEEEDTKIWHLTCKHDYVDETENSPFMQIIGCLKQTTGQAREQVLKDALLSPCPNVVKYLFDNKLVSKDDFDVLERESIWKNLSDAKIAEHLQANGFDVNEHDGLLDYVIDGNLDYTERGESMSRDLHLLALLNAGIKGVKEAITKWTGQGKDNLVKLMTDHLKKQKTE